MFANVMRNGAMDRLAIGLSGLCLVHCLASAIFLALLASAGGLLVSPMVHELGLSLAIFLGVVALGRGIAEHGFMMPSSVGGMGLGVMAGSLTLPHGGAEVAYTVLGVLILALGHDLNRRAVI
ncbi:MerC domain-containing protein [Sphingosinicella rhizophila]|uniref:MerC domain-containing protein n=1 Tax=Sphingosinicella rhizophila TaxID=3050082 RepID=A0ABU3Q4A8_9SPHN|nr:MerC domain-containing protein [Sphingosinicella sp. GR2756]MDT9598246.1 MerC domain-containing protein [Sphingosinicella sp. GR2756]